MVWRIIWTVLIIIAAVLVVLYFAGRRIQKKQAKATETLDAMKQIATVLIIDKKRLPLKQSGLPQTVIDQTPWYMRRSKLPVVKVKVGPRIVTMIADRSVYDMLPVKAECKVEVSGIYITDIRSVRGGVIKAPEKKGFRQKMADRYKTMRDESAGTSGNRATRRSQKSGKNQAQKQVIKNQKKKR